MAAIPVDAWPAGDLLAWDDDETLMHWDFTTEPYTQTPYTDTERAEAEERLAVVQSVDMVAALRVEVSDLLAQEPRPLTRAMTIVEALARLALEVP